MKNKNAGARRARQSVGLVVVALMCAGFSQCNIVNSNPSADQMVAANSSWIVTGMNFKWNFAAVPGTPLAQFAPVTIQPSYFSGGTQLVPNGLFACPGGAASCYVNVPAPTPCPGMDLLGEPQVVADPVDARLWFHINGNGAYGCLFATTSAGDPRGPFLPGFRTTLADGLHLTVTTDKVLLTGFIGPGTLGGYAISRSDMISSISPPRIQTLSFPGGWPLHNYTTLAPTAAYFYSSNGVASSIHLARVDGMPPTGVTVTQYDIALPTVLFMGAKPGDTTQPDGSTVTFPEMTPGIWVSPDDGWIADISQTPWGPAVCAYHLSGLASGAPALADYSCDGGPLAPANGRTSVGASMGCPVIAARFDGTVVIGVSGAGLPGEYLTAYRKVLPGGTWGVAAQGKGPGLGNGAYTIRLDYCTAMTTLPVQTTACAVQAFFDGHDGTVNTYSAATWCAGA